MDEQFKINNSLIVDVDQYNFLHSSFKNFSRDYSRNNNNSRLSDYSHANLTKQFESYINDSLFNNTVIDKERDSMSVLIPMTVCYVIIFLAGLLGNVITCTVISRNKVMHTATNCYLFNLAISDLILLISGMPPDLYNMWYPASYPFSHSICVVHGLLQETSANATVLTITSFTIERYIAICHPFRQHQMSKIPRTIKFIMAIWVLAFCLASPQAFQFSVMDYDGGGRLCTVHKSDNNAIWAHAFEVSGFLFFVGPMTVICVLYVLIGLKLRQSKLLQGVKRKGSEFDKNHDKRTGQTRVIRMLVAVAVAFFFCWAPFHAQRLMAVYGAMQNSLNDMILFGKVYLVLTYVSGVLYFLSTCINPLLYNIMSHKFRDSFKATLFKNRNNRRSTTYSALSRHGGSVKVSTTTTTTRIGLSDGQPPSSDCKREQVCDNNRNNYGNSTSKQNTNSVMNNNNHRNNVNSQLICSRADSADDTDAKLSINHNSNNNNSSSVKKQSSNTLITIAEKLRRNTKSILNFKPASTAVPATIIPIDEVIVNQSATENNCNTNTTTNNLLQIEHKKLSKDNSIESGGNTTNTISNSSLQELDKDEFTCVELAKYMGEINNDIKQDKTL